MTTPDTEFTDRWVTLADGARYLACSTETIRRRVRDGSLPVARLGRGVRVRIADLDALLVPQPVR